jgi:hypothetical protein
MLKLFSAMCYSSSIATCQQIGELASVLMLYTYVWHYTLCPVQLLSALLSSQLWQLFRDDCLEENVPGRQQDREAQVLHHLLNILPTNFQKY